MRVFVSFACSHLFMWLYLCLCFVGVTGGTSVPVARWTREDSNDLGGPVDDDEAPANHSVTGATPEADVMAVGQQTGTFRMKSLNSSAEIVNIGSASDPIMCVRCVRERERKIRRETDGSDITLLALKLAKSFALFLAKNAEIGEGFCTFPCQNGGEEFCTFPCQKLAP